ncbi:MAG: flagellar hook assembly protein FlgD [Zetaproteobacteria bacterium]|nr:flagellar hook assembly protein FlgD [Zetaproteobacteria bacterium]
MDPKIRAKITSHTPNPSRQSNARETEAVSTKETIDFQKLILDSNAEQVAARERVNNHDLSGATSYQDFLEALDRKQQMEQGPKNTMGKDEFLTLFVTQLQNQDPLNPKDGTEMASQLAQFNSLEQMINMNTSLDQLGSTAEKSRTAQFLDAIGKEITLAGGKGSYHEGKVEGVTYSLPMTATKLKLLTKDQNGNVVAHAELPGQSAGEHALDLSEIELTHKDGSSLLPGIYQFELEGQDMNSQQIPITMNSKVKITGVSMEGNEPGFLTPIGTISFDQVQAVGLVHPSEVQVQQPTAGTRKPSQPAKAHQTEPRSLQPSASSTNSQARPPAQTLEAARKAAAQMIANRQTPRTTPNASQTP